MEYISAFKLRPIELCEEREECWIGKGKKIDKYLYSFFSSGSVMRGDEETFVCFTRGGAGASVRCQARVHIVSPGASVNTVQRT